jgi:hypothetical protein
MSSKKRRRRWPATYMLKQTRKSTANAVSRPTFTGGVPALGTLAGSFLPSGLPPEALTVEEEAALKVHREEATKKARKKASEMAASAQTRQSE